MSRKFWRATDSKSQLTGNMKCCSCKTDISGIYRYYMNYKLDGYVNQCFECSKDTKEIKNYIKNLKVQEDRNKLLKSKIEDLIVEFDLDPESRFEDYL